MVRISVWIFVTSCFNLRLLVEYKDIASIHWDWKIGMYRNDRSF